MFENIDLNEDFRLALCCKPGPGDEVAGFLRLDLGVISVHRRGCPNLEAIQLDRLIKLDWSEILLPGSRKDPEYDPVSGNLDEIDLRILQHHAEMGVDYAAAVAKHLHIDRAIVFEKHRKLWDFKLLARVQPKMIRYRKNIVDNKWIKHRNHTYYEMTEKGLQVLRQFQK
jgi:hypothetical protein